MRPEFWNKQFNSAFASLPFHFLHSFNVQETEWCYKWTDDIAHPCWHQDESLSPASFLTSGGTTQ